MMHEYTFSLILYLNIFSVCLQQHLDTMLIKGSSGSKIFVLKDGIRYFIEEGNLKLIGKDYDDVVVLPDKLVIDIPKLNDYTINQLYMEGASLKDLVDDSEPMRLAKMSWDINRLYPVSFGLSKSKFVELESIDSLMQIKAREWAVIIPGKKETYIFKDEESYRKGYQESWKAHTWTKAGADCYRHLEIISNGAIPIYKNIQSVNKGTLFAYPKRLLAMFEENQSETNKTKLAEWRNLILKWGHMHLTSVAMVQYMTEITGLRNEIEMKSAKNITSVLLINKFLPHTEGDYLSTTIITGFIEWLGIGSIDIMYVPYYLFKGEEEKVKKRSVPLYGKGFSYSHNLPPLSENYKSNRRERRIEMMRKLKDRFYSIVIYSEFRRSNEYFYDITLPLYSNDPKRLWLLDGKDKFDGWPFSLRYGHLRYNSTIFVRELW